MAYKMIIKANLIDNNERYLEFDTVKSRQINSSSQIASQPLQDGTFFADHIWRLPVTVDVTGTFSLQGSWQKNGMDSFSLENIIGNSNLVKENGETVDIGELRSLNDLDRLGNIQKVLEYIKNRGILCDLMFIDRDNSNSIRFKQRKNMALKDISWTEGYNSMEYNIKFQEVMKASLSVDEVANFTDYPHTSMPIAKTLGEVMSDTSKVVDMIIQVMLEKGWIYKRDALMYAKVYEQTYISNYNVDYQNFAGVMESIGLSIVNYMVAVVGAFVVTGVVSVLGAIGLTTVSLWPVGTIITIAVAAVVAVITAIISIFKKKEKNENRKKVINLVVDFERYIDRDYKLKKDADVSTAKINDPGVNKLIRIINNVADKTKTLATSCKIYSISSSQDDNDERDLTLMVDNHYLTFRFTKTSNRDYPWRCVVYEDDKVVSNLGWDLCSDVSDCDRDKTAIYARGNYEIYLFCVSAVDGSTQEEEDNYRKYLCTYSLWVNNGSMKQTWKELKSQMLKALENEGYKA